MMYVRAAILIVFLGLGLLALWYRGEANSASAARDQAEAALGVATAANEEAVRTIANLQEQARLDGRLTASLLAQLRSINNRVEAQNAALAELERTNADVRDYLDADVPADLRKLHNR